MSYTVDHELKDVGTRAPWWLVVAVLVLSVAALVGAAIYIAHRIGYAAGKENAVVLTKTCNPPERPAVRWQCDAVERREYLNVCLKRKAT